MSRSRWYQERRRPRGNGKGEWWDTLHIKRERLRSHLDLVDGEREYRDCVDEFVSVLDYCTGWVHEHEARFRNHRMRGASRRDKSKPRLWCHRYPCGCVLQLRRDLKLCKFMGFECNKGVHRLPDGYRYHIGSSLPFMPRKDLR